MFKFIRRKKQSEAVLFDQLAGQPESFEQLARKASEHEDCFILAAFPKLPGQPEESRIDEDELGRVIFNAVGDYLATLDYTDYYESV
jgi:Ser/Thr protein kinase RdoA (MazF antagonist)